MTDVNKKNMPGRPVGSVQKEKRARRPRKRTEDKGPLFIENKDPEYFYFWELDTSPSGPKCFRRLQNDWEFVSKDEGLKIGDGYVYDAGDVGNIYRVPAVRPEGHYHFLMKIRKEWADEDYQEEQDRITSREKSLYKPDKKDGQYGYTGYE